MPYPFSLPTTSSLLLSSHLSSPTHPSLPLTATTYRTVLRDVLKRHKRLAPQSQLSHLGRVLSALNDYLPYLFALDAGLSNGGEDEGDDEHDGVDDYYLIDVVLECEVEVQWRATLTATLPGREPGRVKVRSLEYEICFVLATLAYTHTLLARNQLYLWKDPTATTTPLQQQRTTAIQTATKHLLQSASIHSYIAVQRSTQWAVPSPVLDISTSVQTALSSLALAEASLLAVLKDDPYAAAVAKDRDKNDNDWMVKAPEIPKVRAHLFARLCLSAAEHAGRASAMLRTAGGNNATTKAAAVDETLVGYVDDVRRTARGKACRFLGIDADLSGQIGVAIAWLLAAKTELGVHVEKGNGGGAGGIVGRRWKERREERKSEKGFDGGKVEESRIVNMLETKWTKINDTIHAQLIPSHEILLTTKLPLGRDIHTVPMFVEPKLDREVLVSMIDPAVGDHDIFLANAGHDVGHDDDDDSGDEQSSEVSKGGEDESRAAGTRRLPGTFPEVGHGDGLVREYY